MQLRQVFIVALIAAALAIGVFLFYASRSKDVVLFYHGGAPEVP
jgi:hypothetical protein